MRCFRLVVIAVLFLACTILGTACAGSKGEQGSDGVGIQDVVFNPDGTMTINFTNGGKYTSGNLVGPQGPKGDTGAVGATGAPGATGATGLPGAGVSWKGEWSGSTTYSEDDAVGYLGSSYISMQNGNINHLPTETAWWDLWVAKGETGATGAAGPTGETGATGATGSAGPPGPNMVVAMGVYESNGVGHQVYGIASCNWVAADHWYDITLVGRSYYFLDYVTVVTPTGDDRHAVYNSVSGHLLVSIYDNAGNAVQNNFSVIVLSTST